MKLSYVMVAQLLNFEAVTPPFKQIIHDERALQSKS